MPRGPFAGKLRPVCGLTGFIDLERRLAVTQLAGTNKNTGLQVNEWGCAVLWLPLLLIENANEQRQTGAAVESLLGGLRGFLRQHGEHGDGQIPGRGGRGGEVQRNVR